jgi:uncharacterized protein with NRDE domain
MCLALIALDVHPRHAAVLIANRDEWQARAAAPAQWWPQGERDGGILAGRDLAAGGTWLGVNRRGRYAFVTNVREPGRHDPAAPTRGTLVPRVLADARPLETALAAAVAAGSAMNGFNLLAGEGVHAAWGSNRGPSSRTLGAGVHGLSNAALDTPWPKLVRTRAALADWVARGDDDIEALFRLLADRSCADDADLPRTGVSAEWERLLSAAFIDAPDYGTRCTTVLLAGRDGMLRLIERSFAPGGAITGEVDLRFAVEPAAGPGGD